MRGGSCFLVYFIFSRNLGQLWVLGLLAYLRMLVCWCTTPSGSSATRWISKTLDRGVGEGCDDPPWRRDVDYLDNVVSSTG